MIPRSRPKQSRDKTQELIEGVESPVVILGVRGYYSRTFGKPGNDINVYDDALFVFSDNGYMTFNANTDPAVARHRVATLKPGVWYYRLGTHNITRPRKFQYPALVQAAPVTVMRQGAGEDTGWFGINIHRGGRTTTSSLGCITVPQQGGQWDEFYAVVRGEMTRAKISRIPFVLVENKD